MKAMSDLEINNHFKGSKLYGGTFSKDQLPAKMLNKAYIINMEDSDKGNGSHWVACCAVRPKEIYYFDSFGSEVPIEIIKFMKTNRKCKKYLTRNIEDLQDINTQSCGQFCIYFLTQSMRGKSFKNTLTEFTSNPVINEHLLLANFGSNKAFTEAGITESIHRQHKKLTGSGIRDIYNYMKAKLVGGVNRVKDVLQGQRNGAPPKVRSYIEKYGSEVVTHIRVCRQPVFSVIEKFANAFSLGVFQSNKNALEYEKMFHLFLIIKTNVGNYIRLEKNHVVEIGGISTWDTSSKTQFVDLPVSSGLTFSGFFDNAMTKVSPHQLWIYDSVKANCQIFCRDMLQSSGLLTDQSNKFIVQNAEAVMNGLGYITKTFRKITDVASVADVAMNGAGVKARKKRGKGFDVDAFNAYLQKRDNDMASVFAAARNH